MNREGVENILSGREWDLKNWGVWVGCQYRHVGRGRGCHLPAFLDLPLFKCAYQEHMIDMIKNMEDLPEALWESE